MIELHGAAVVVAILVAVVFGAMVIVGVVAYLEGVDRRLELHTRHRR